MTIILGFDFLAVSKHLIQVGGFYYEYHLLEVDDALDYDGHKHCD